MCERQQLGFSNVLACIDIMNTECAVKSPVTVKNQCCKRQKFGNKLYAKSNDANLLTVP